jgi:hypothetical protein
MSISAVSSSAVGYMPPSTPAPAQPATDNDGDNDNGAPDVKAATPPGVGVNLDMKV